MIYHNPVTFVLGDLKVIILERLRFVRFCDITSPDSAQTVEEELDKHAVMSPIGFYQKTDLKLLFFSYWFDVTLQKGEDTST